jgi:hypothetical protein
MLIPRFRFNLKNIANYETSRLVAGELEKQICPSLVKKKIPTLSCIL